MDGVLVFIKWGFSFVVLHWENLHEGCSW